MKNVILIITLFFVCLNSFSQDTIFMMNKEIRYGKVELVSPVEIKYRNIQNPTGPVYTIESKSISHITYSNGSIDTINLNKKMDAEVIPIKVDPPTTSQIPKMVISSKGVIMLDNRKLNDFAIRTKITEYPYPKNKKLMMREFEKMNEYKRNEIIAGTAGWVIGFGIPIVVTYAALFDYNNSSISNGLDPTTVIVTGALTGALVRTMGQVFKKINKNKKLHQRDVIANLYNEMQ